MELLFSDQTQYLSHHLLGSSEDLGEMVFRDEHFPGLSKRSPQGVRDGIDKRLQRGEVVGVSVSGENRLVAFLILRLVEDEVLDTEDSGRVITLARRVMHLDWLEVSTEFRGTGIGSALATFVHPLLDANVIGLPGDNRSRDYMVNRLGFIEMDPSIRGMDEHVYLPFEKANSHLASLVISDPERYIPSLKRIQEERADMVGEGDPLEGVVGDVDDELSRIIGRTPAKRLFHLGRLSTLVNDGEMAERYYRLAMTESDRMMDMNTHLDCIKALGRQVFKESRFQEAMSLNEELKVLARLYNDPDAVADAYDGEASIRWREGDYPGAISTLDSCIEEVGDTMSIHKSGEIHTTYGNIHIELGDREGTRRHLEIAEQCFTTTRDPVGIAKVLNNLAESELRAGNVDVALGLSMKADDIITRTGDLVIAAYSRLTLAEARLLTGTSPIDILPLLKDSRDTFRRARYQHAEHYADLLIGMCEMREGNTLAARSHLDRSITAFESLSMPSDACKAYIERATLRKSHGDPAWKADLDSAHLLASTLKSEPYLSRLRELGHDLDDDEAPWND